MLNEKYFPRDEYFTKSDDHDDVYPKHPHLQLRGLCYEKTTKSGADRRVILDNISMEVKAGEIVGILATNGIHLPRFFLSEFFRIAVSG